MNYKQITMVVSAALLMSASGRGIYDDSVFFFEGGRDGYNGLSADGAFQKGEFVDELHAGVPTHGNHQATMSGAAANIAWSTENVNFHAAGMGVKSLPCLKFIPTDATFSFSTIELPFIGDLCPGKYYSAIFRIRRDEKSIDFAQTIMSFGFDKTVAGHGWLLFLNTDGDLSTHCADSASPGALRLAKKINVGDWVDIGVVMNENVVTYHVAFPGADTTSAQYGPGQIYHYTQTFLKSDKTKPDTSMVKNYIRFGGQAKGGTATDANGKKYFSGALQRMAFWNRTLSNDEIAEAFAFPRPSHVFIGAQNGHSDEFSSSDSVTATIGPGLLQTDSWTNFPSGIRAGDKRTIKFNMNAYDSTLPQLLVIKPLADAPAGTFKITLNNQVLSGSEQMKAGAKLKFPIRAKSTRTPFVSGTNELVIERVDNGAKIGIDAIWLGGSWYVGVPDNNSLELGWHYISSSMLYLDSYSFLRAVNRNTCTYSACAPADVTESYAAKAGIRYRRDTGTGDTDLYFSIDGGEETHLPISTAFADYWAPVAAGSHTVKLRSTGTTGIYWLDCYMMSFEPPKLGLFLVVK